MGVLWLSSSAGSESEAPLSSSVSLWFVSLWFDTSLSLSLWCGGGLSLTGWPGGDPLSVWRWR